MNLAGNKVFNLRGKGMGFTLVGLGLLSILLLLTSVPTIAESSVTVERDSLYTAYKTENADVIKARSGRFHIDTERTVIVETSAGAAAVSRGHAIVTVTPRSLEVHSLRNATLIQTETGTTTVAEGQTVQLTSPPPQEDPVLTSLGMCE